MAHLRALFSGTADGLGDASELIAFRQEWLSGEEATKAGIGTHDKGSFQLAMVWAAFANTIPSAFWSVFCMFKDGCADVCREEAMAVLTPLVQTEEAGNMELAGALHSQLPVINSVISEALRLCIASLTVRRVTESFDLTLKGSGSSVRVRKGDRIALAPVLTHMDSTIYRDPKRFNRQRFLKQGAESKDPAADDEAPQKGLPASIQLQPFGGGVSMCPGRHLAMGEIRAFVAQVALRWEIELPGAPNEGMSLEGAGVPPLDMARAGLGSLPPVGKVPCRIRLRKPTS